ncbi:uncharacterized protein LOC129741945 [Uranotaenia lowii]|uniref:uncharacterized protein LOC129741945 n=1 Tax=Uranotaenia lowii TaxID=190385 RepID=UPI00247A2109|nr:uncharacterized protein LOC129741945 [Uranotaenia lowii]
MHDHSLVLTTINLKKPVVYRKLETQHESLNAEFLVEVEHIQASNALEKLNKIIELHSALKARHSKTISAEVKVKGYCPWMSLDVWKLIRIKENSLARCKKYPANDHLKDLLLHVSKKLQCAKAEAKKGYYHKLFHTSNQKKTWKNLNELIGRNESRSESIKLELNGTITEEGKSVANAFNEYFCNIGSQLAATIPRNAQINGTPSFGNRDSIYMQPATEQEVLILINNLDSSKSPGPDGISAQFVKTHHNILAPLIRDIFNDCIQSGGFPESLKTAHVIPIYKAGKKTNCSNYRPISVLSVFSKILEKLLATRVLQFLKQHNLLYCYQYGFREGSSTLTAATELVDAIHNALDNRKLMGVLFLDLKKAFDTIDHSILLNKLDAYGIRGIANSLFADYLANRKQYVQINQSTSDLGYLPVGVPQGSNLGPLLFILYVNDIHRLHLHGKPRLFADDTSLSYENCDVRIVVAQMSEDLKTLQEYFNSNLLSLNLDKTKYVMFRSTYRQPESHNQLQVGSTVIEQVNSFKYLGLIFDELVRWDKHIDRLRKELSAIHSMIWKLSRFVPTKHLTHLYHAFVQSKLQYMVSVWGAARKRDIKPLQALQNRCLKGVFKKPRLFPTINLFEAAPASVLPIAALRELQSVVQIHSWVWVGLLIGREKTTTTTPPPVSDSNPLLEVNLLAAAERMDGAPTAAGLGRMRQEWDRSDRENCKPGWITGLLNDWRETLHHSLLLMMELATSGVRRHTQSQEDCCCCCCCFWRARIEEEVRRHGRKPPEPHPSAENGESSALVAFDTRHMLEYT